MIIIHAIFDELVKVEMQTASKIVRRQDAQILRSAAQRSMRTFYEIINIGIVLSIVLLR